ncbi:hypothetical protein VTK26DRAFT_3643 [Humicola hyalothermophila]
MRNEASSVDQISISNSLVVGARAICDIAGQPLLVPSDCRCPNAMDGGCTFRNAHPFSVPESEFIFSTA